VPTRRSSVDSEGTLSSLMRAARHGNWGGTSNALTLRQISEYSGVIPNIRSGIATRVRRKPLIINANENLSFGTRSAKPFLRKHYGTYHPILEEQ
jgi:hypothetical protein